MNTENADFPRLIENAFPLKQASLDSVREKYGPRGHISGFHLWPARRPLAACRAALIATLLPDPGTPDERRELCELIGGTVVKITERKKMPGGSAVEREKEETEGGVLQWKRETENISQIEQFRQEIRRTFGGRAPHVFDPFSGGGAIPFEAMRLGCETTAVDLNPVAWFILKCTLEYPQKLAGQKRLLPAFILDNENFMDVFYKANPDAVGKGKATKKQKGTLFAASKATHGPNADLAWHVRAWGQWVLTHARQELAGLYPTYADFEPLKKEQIAYEHRPMTLVPLKPDGAADIASLNADSSVDYLAVKANPRWIAKPTVAYLWARTVKCKNCRAELPLLKTRWLCKKDSKRVLLTMVPKEDKTGVAFGIQTNVPVQGGNAAQKREHDKRIAAGTMSRAGAKCPCCPAIMTMEDIRVEGKADRLGAILTVVAVDGLVGKEYRLPTGLERMVVTEASDKLADTFSHIPLGFVDEPTPAGGGSGASRAFSVQRYGMMRWRDLFTARQQLSLGRLVIAIRAATEACRSLDYPADWLEAIHSYLACSLDRLVDQLTTVCTWYIPGENVKHTYVRYALPIMWDYAEANPLFEGGGSWSSAILNCTAALEHALRAMAASPVPTILRCSSTHLKLGKPVDVIITDPPYYDAIPYSDMMDMFYVWLRRSLVGASPAFDFMSTQQLSPKWDNDKADGELIDDESRHGGDRKCSRDVYENGMFQAFETCWRALTDSGRLVVVFANKQPEAWETLVSALIRAGFVVDGSWPIQTENATRSRARASAALASSLWMVCRKRPESAKPGWDNIVIAEMEERIRVRLRDFWDAGIRGPDFVWAATGPALEAYSKHPAVKKADQPGKIMTVAEFLNHVRRLVVDYVVGKVLSGEKDGAAEASATDRLDEPTAYYLLHRHDFGLDEAPVGTCILYAVSCNLSDSELVQTWEILAKTGADDVDEDETGTAEAEDGEEVPESTGGKVRLKTWSQRKNKSMGYEAPNGRSVPLIDRVHRLMHLWKAGDLQKVDEYLDEHGMRRHELFKRLVQSLIELSEAGSDERSLLESLSNHIGAKGTKADADQIKMNYGDEHAGDGETKE